MKPRVLKSRNYKGKWLVVAGARGNYFPTWREAFDWAYAHAAQHRS